MNGRDGGEAQQQQQQQQREAQQRSAPRTRLSLRRRHCAARRRKGGGSGASRAPAQRTRRAATAAPVTLCVTAHRNHAQNTPEKGEDGERARAQKESARERRGRACGDGENRAIKGDDDGAGRKTTAAPARAHRRGDLPGVCHVTERGKCGRASFVENRTTDDSDRRRARHIIK